MDGRSEEGTMDDRIGTMESYIGGLERGWRRDHYECQLRGIRYWQERGQVGMSRSMLVSLEVEIDRPRRG
jgi:hypothetical protein